jgi:hypothetical protein
MAILDEYVTVRLVNTSIAYYENLGYEIPRYEYEKGKFRVKNGTEIVVKTKDLKHDSNIKLNAMCDCCGKRKYMAYNAYNKNISKHNGLYICSTDRTHRQFMGDITLDCALNKIIDFYNNNDRFPKYNEFTVKNGFDFSYAKFSILCKENDSTPQDEYAKIDCFKSEPNIKYYDKYLERLLYIINNVDSGIGSNLSKLSQGDYCKKYGLPNYRWFIDNCPDKSVHNDVTFKEFAGIKQRFLTKEQCIENILKMSEEFDRPLKYDDFRNKQYNKVTVDMVKRYWGSLNKMKEELGLEIIQPQMIKITQESFDRTIRILKQYLEDNNKEFITTTEWNSLNFDGFYKYLSVSKFVEENLHMPLPDYLLTQGIRMGEAGEGIKNIFDDGEITTSQFEYMFSSFIRRMGFRYNVDYFRNVRYSTFCDDYSGMRDCDYVIKHNNQTIYIEIAGIIGQYKPFYYSDKPITSSKSKEQYRQKLKDKEQLLISNNHIYFILFPCDLTEENIEQVIKNPTIELRKQIEAFNRTNIDFVNVRKIGKLDYDNPAIVRHLDWETHRKIPVIA